MALQGTSPFSITILDASGNVVGDGPLTTATDCDTVEKLDEIGEVNFSVPANDPRAVEIRSGRQFDIYDAQDGYLGRFTFCDSTIRENQGVATRVVKAYDSLISLKRETVGFKRKYTFHDVGQVVTELAGIAGFTVEADAGIGNTTLTLEGESPLRGIDEMRDRFKQHFRLKRGTFDVLQFGALGQSSGIRITNLPGQLQTVVAGAQEIALAGPVKVNEDAEGIYNRVIAVGGGQNEAQITMEGATAGTYALQTFTNQDGSSYFGVQDDTSIAAYGLRTKILALPNVRPTDNNATAKTRAADTLKLTAEAFLRLNKDPVFTYDASAYKVAPSLQVGDKIRLKYREERDNIVYLDVDEDLYVMAMEKSRSATGKRSVGFVFSDTGEKRTNDQDVLVETIRQVTVLKVHAQPTATVYQFASSDVMQANVSPLGGARATFTVSNDLTNVSRVILNFRARRIKHWIRQLPSGSSDRLYYNINFASTGTSPLTHPDYLRLKIDDVINNNYGIDWRWSEPDVLSSNPYGIDISIDITDAIVNSALGLYATHTLELYSTTSILSSILGIEGEDIGGALNANLGIIDFNVRVEGITQAILSE